MCWSTTTDAAEYLDSTSNPFADGRSAGGENMYEKDGEKYFVVDGHTHFWDASPQNWVPGQEEYAKGWIECFHAYHGLGPAETHWPLDRFQKYSEELMMHDLFEVGHVDKAIFQPTNLRQWYT